MPDNADPQPRHASPETGAPTTFKPVALPALAGVLNARKICERKAAAKATPRHEDLDRFGRSYTA